MPKIPEGILYTTFYLYPSVEDAKAGKKFGGTGFFVNIPSKANPAIHIVFAVTNWHVAVQGGCSVIRLNRNSGGSDVFEFGPEEWVFEPNGYDVAILPFTKASARTHKMSSVAVRLSVTHDVLTELKIGPGDDVFMLGRFIDHDGGETNAPAVRFGNISMMPDGKIRQPNNVDKDMYCVDVRSRSGFSGSPVFVYRTAVSNLENLSSISLGGSNQFLVLLGVHWGQFPERWEVSALEDGAETQESWQTGDRAYVKGLSGMTCVAPAWAILELLDTPAIKAFVEQCERDIAAKGKG
jgi:hypothetical protein